MTFALLTRIGGPIIAFHSSAVLVTWEIIICPTLQFSVSSWTTTSRRVLRTEFSIAALSQGTIDRRSISSTLISFWIFAIASRDFSMVFPQATTVMSEPLVH